MTTAQQLIQGALLNVNAYAPGEAIRAADSANALEVLNDLLESWDNDRAQIYCTAENVFNYVSGQYQYTVGNYDAGQFAGIVTSASFTVTGVTVPADMIARGDLTGTGIPAGTTIVSTNPGAGTILMSAAATSTPGTQQIRYTIPGNFKMSRPLRVLDSYTRINGSTSALDYPITVVSRERYNEIGFKAIDSPWPVVVWYNPTMPFGTLSFYQAPSDPAELHLFTDVLLTNFAALTTDVRMPQGYSRMLKWCLAKELAPQFGKEWGMTNEKNMADALMKVRQLNKQPVSVATFDGELFGGAHTDAGWYLMGGFR